MRADIVPGAVLPDCELTDRAAKRRKLCGQQGPDPTIVVLSRGGYCVTIGADNPIATNAYRTAVGAHGPVHDPVFGRPTVEDLRQDLRAVSKKCRPNWDIASPELSAAWKRGERDRFYPYGKSYSKLFAEQE
jgi:hypothetical protein